MKDVEDTVPPSYSNEKFCGILNKFVRNKRMSLYATMVERNLLELKELIAPYLEYSEKGPLSAEELSEIKETFTVALALMPSCRIAIADLVMRTDERYSINEKFGDVPKKFAMHLTDSLPRNINFEIIGKSILVLNEIIDRRLQLVHDIKCEMQAVQFPDTHQILVDSSDGTISTKNVAVDLAA